jgi:GNAT superfamily N-acetyltransferase
MNDISFRQMTEYDLAGADALRRLVGWNQTPADWRRFLKLSPKGCFVATKDRTLLGTVTSITYDQRLSWIGMMLVHPDHRRQGIGRGLMGRLVSHLQGRGVTCIKLDATPAGFPLYEQLGFVPEWTLTRWQGPGKTDAPPLEGASDGTRTLRDTDWAAVEEIDTPVLGVSRGSLIRSLAQHSRRVLVWPSQGRVAGWGLMRAGANADYLGPLVCPKNDGALSLVHGLLVSSENRLVFWDVPDGNGAATSAVQRLGFTPVRPLTRMRLGPPLVKGDPQAQFAIADPSTG